MPNITLVVCFKSVIITESFNIIRLTRVKVKELTRFLTIYELISQNKKV